MKVGIVTGAVSRNGAGVAEAIRGLALALRRCGDVDVEIFGFSDEFTAEDMQRWQGLPVHALPISWPRAFGYAPEMFQRIREAKLDLLHVTCLWMYPSLMSLRWMREVKGPVVISTHGYLDRWALANSRWKKEAAAALYERRHLRQAACLHAICEPEMRSLRDFGLVNPICVIPNGVDLPDALDGPAPAWANQASEASKTLLFLGRVHPKKNIIPLIEAWAEVSRDEPLARDWRLVIAGWDQVGYERKCRAAVARTKAPRVVFAGPQHGPDKAASYRAAAAFTLPSLSEGLPLTVLEAWSYGLPALITPPCNIPEGVEAGAAIETSVSAAAIGAGLRRLFRMSEEERAKMGQAGRALVEQRFTWTQVGLQMRTLYRWLLMEGTPPERVFFHARQSPPKQARDAWVAAEQAVS